MDELHSVIVPTEPQHLHRKTPTFIKHGNHTGRLRDGKLHCTENGWDATFECTLDVDEALCCQLVELLDGHVHGPGCGHEMIPHGDHHDYLVGGRLHHVMLYSGECCPSKCLGFLEPATVVDHGEVLVLDPSEHPDVLDTMRPIGVGSGRCGGHKKCSSSRCSRPVEEFREELQDITVPLLPQEDQDDFPQTSTTMLHAAGICCPSEERTIRRLLGGLPGIESVDIMVMTKTVKIVHDPCIIPCTVILATLNEAGLQASMGRRGKQKEKLASVPWHVMISGLLMAVALVSCFIPALHYLKWVALGAVVCGIPYILLRAFAAVKQLQLDINILMIFSVIGAIAIGEYLEAGAIVFLFGLSEWMEDKCMGKAKAAVGFLMEMQPEVALSAETNQTIPAEQVKVNDLLIVRPGDRVAVDAVVVSGESVFDESMLTGETKPVAKLPGNEVVSGTVNTGYGSVTIQAEKAMHDSTISQLASKVEEASMQKSKTGRLVEKIASYYTPLVVLSAILLVIVPSILREFGYTEGRSLKDWVYLAIVMLVCACPCALVISTPVVTVSGISRAARQSVLIKGGQFLEALANIKAITFDKTGTLTEGRFGIVAIVPVKDQSEEDVLRLAAPLELHSTHPLGPAIVASAAARGISLRSRVSQVETVAGKGIRGIVDGVPVSVGNMALVAEDAPGSLVPAVPTDEHGSICCVSAGGKVVGVLVVSDSVRSNSKECVDTLKKMGITVGMLTGDRSLTAKAIGRALGLFRSHTHSDLLPDDKLDLVSEYLNTFGSVAHIGDGINDALALARANVGIAMGVGGSAMAVEAADVALFSNDLMNLPFVLLLAKAARRKLLFNILISILIKVVVIVLAILGHVGLWMAVLADVGSAVLVTLNGLTLLWFQPSKAPSQDKNSCAGGKKKSGGCCGPKKRKCGVNGGVRAHEQEQNHGHDHAHGHEHQDAHRQELGQQGCCGNAQGHDESSGHTGSHNSGKLAEQSSCASQETGNSHNDIGAHGRKRGKCCGGAAVENSGESTV